MGAPFNATATICHHPEPVLHNAHSVHLPILSLRHVGKVFGGTVTALDDMSLDIYDGDFVSLLGPSGCGKSTALRLIAGLMRPTSGASPGRRPSARAPAGRSLAWSFRNPRSCPGQRWKTMSGCPCVWRTSRRRRFAKPSTKSSTSSACLGFEKAYPRELSGGMKMRVSIARAMVTRPKLILMDEPFAALDEITRFKLNNDLLEMQARIGCTVIFVTHSVFESVFLSNRVVVMAARPGRVVQELASTSPIRARKLPHLAGICRPLPSGVRRPCMARSWTPMRRQPDGRDLQR
jgi:NitT/TauT family transport system ATP-binding protein